MNTTYLKLKAIKESAPIAIELAMMVNSNELNTIYSLGDTTLDTHNKNRRIDENITKFEYIDESFGITNNNMENGIIMMLNDFLNSRKCDNTEERCLAMLLLYKGLHGILNQIDFSAKVKEILFDLYETMFETRGNCVESLMSYLNDMDLPIHAQYANLYSRELFLMPKPEQLWVAAMKNAWAKGEGEPNDEDVIASYNKYLEIRATYRTSSVDVQLKSLYPVFNVPASSYRENRTTVLRKIINYYNDSTYSAYITYLTNV